ncbi:MAG TPA: hypothetical protein VFQ13_21060, partial [Anaerolineales bacterium]|nr:hypothetical protein [Anaerolineales bacterium]
MKTRLSKIFSGFLIALCISSIVLSGAVSAIPDQTHQLAPTAKHEPKRGVNPETGKVSFIGGGEPIKVTGVSAVKSLSLPERGLQMANAYGREFGLQNPAQELKQLKAEKDAKGNDIIRFQQMHQGVPILSGEMIVNMNANGDLLSISGEVASDLSLDIKPAIKAQDARKSALAEIARLHGVEEAQLDSSDPELWIFDESILVASTRPAELVWRMEVTAKPAIQPIREMVLVDAQTGNVSFHINQMDTQTSWPVYFDLELDEARGWMYGSDSNGNKIDVISMSTLQVVKSFVLTSGAYPKGIALSPDGSELTIAQKGAASILFINPDTGATIATITPNTASGTGPYDLIYGRLGRLYASGTTDYIHIIDTAAHSEIGRSTNTISGSPYLAISSTKNLLFANNSNSPNSLYRYDVSTDNLSNPISTNNAIHEFSGKTYVLLPDDSKIFTSSNQVWNSDLSLKIGGITPAYDSSGILLSGRPAILPNHDAVVVAVDNLSGSDTLAFVSTTDFYTLTRYTLPNAGTLGPMAASADGTKLYVSSGNGITALDLSSSLPGTSVPLPSGPLPYHDLILDEARGVLYGSDYSGNKIDVISMTTQEVIKSFRLVNGAWPRGIALSPDGRELVIAQSESIGLLFIDPDTGETLATFPGRTSDVIYGRTDRLYVLNQGHVDVIDTVTRTRINTAPGNVLSASYLTLSSDNNTLFANGPTNLYKVDVSIDTLPVPTGMTISSYPCNKSVLLVDDTKIFTDCYQVWRSDFKGQLGSIEYKADTKRTLASLPNRNVAALSVDNTYGNDEVWFISTDDFYTLSKYTLPAATTPGSMVASADGNTLYVSTADGMVALSLTPSLPGNPVPLPSASLPYEDVVLDEARGVLYGSDITSHSIDVISTTTLQVVNSFRLVNGASPQAIALSPDGGELAVAEGGASSLLFLNPETGEMMASIIPNTTSNSPYDVVYGRSGRLYSSGSSDPYIHVIDTSTHIEVARSVSVASLTQTRLAISSDNNWLYASRSSGSPMNLFRFDVSTDVIPTPTSAPHTGNFSASTYILDPTTNFVFTNTGQIWSADLKGRIGTIDASGQGAYIPSRHAIAVASSTTNSIVFASTENFYTLSTYSLQGPMGPVVSQADGNKLFVSTGTGIVPVDLSNFPPGTPGTLPAGSLPYFDLVLDESRGVLYGSNSAGHKIDVISISTLQIVDQIRFNNGARPQGMDLSPDGSELAVALTGASSVAFVDTATRTISAMVIPNLDGAIAPFDVKYGRPGRLYSSGTASIDRLHVFDTTTHTEVGISPYPNTIYSSPYLSISTDKNSVYANESSNILRHFSVSTDAPTILKSTSSAYRGTNSLLLADNSKVFTNRGQVWPSDLSAQIGSFAALGHLVEIPGQGLVAVVSTASPGLVTFVRSTDYTTASTASLPSVNAVGASTVSSAGDKLFFNTNGGVKVLDISADNPASIAIVSGSPQSVEVSQPFQQPLKVKVQNVFGNPIADLVVTFTAPSTGASGTFVDTNSNVTTVLTDANGMATSSVILANNSADSYVVKATIPNLAASADFQLTNLAAVTCPITTGPGTASLFLPYKQYKCGKVSHGVGAGDFNNDGRKDV